MQSKTSVNQTPAKAVGTLSLTRHLDTPLTERQMAGLHEAWLEHQINPLAEIQMHGVRESALNE